MATAGYLFNERPPVGYLIAQAVGLTATGFLTGANIAISAICVPAVLEAPAPLCAKQWKSIYKKGAATAPPVAVAGALALGYLAYNEDPSSLRFKLNLAAALIVPSIVPFTLTVMKSNVQALLQKADSLAATSIEDKAAEAGVSQSETVHALVDKWATLNLGRVLITGLAGALALWAALDKREAGSFSDFAFKTGANRMG